MTLKFSHNSIFYFFLLLYKFELIIFFVIFKNYLALLISLQNYNTTTFISNCKVITCCIKLYCTDDISYFKINVKKYFSVVPSTASSFELLLSPKACWNFHSLFVVLTIKIFNKLPLPKQTLKTNPDQSPKKKKIWNKKKIWVFTQLDTKKFDWLMERQIVFYYWLTFFLLIGYQLFLFVNPFHWMDAFIKRLFGYNNKPKFSIERLVYVLKLRR